jgi:hypothetical protein
VVDYIGIAQNLKSALGQYAGHGGELAQNLKSALGQYAGHGGEQVGIDEAEAVRVLMEKYETPRAGSTTGRC